MDACAQSEINEGSHQDADFRALSSHYAKGIIVDFDFGSKSSKGLDLGGHSASNKEINDEDARLVFINNPERTNGKFEYPVNKIKTSKYSILTFLPWNLFEQFRRVAYVYFLLIAILNQLPQLAVFGRGVSLIPLAFVLIVSAVKDGYEDYRRHRSDKFENRRLATVLSEYQFQPKKWKDICVGDIIKVYKNETIPCDMVLLSTSDPTGVAYLQTANLDGESNLKARYAKQETQMANPEESISGVIKCEKPNRNIYGFHANMNIEGKLASLGPSNIILRGCELKNTEWAVGIAVYCGKETKAMLNNSGAPSKRSRLETRMNREIIYLSLLLGVMCVIVCTCYGVWLQKHSDELDLMQFFRKTDYSDNESGENYDYSSGIVNTLFDFLMAIIVFQVVIPIALYISMELARLGQAYLMVQDKNMYDEFTNSRFQCRALNINEDLGQIKYVFSDKTGTLTENKMEFQCATVGMVDYSNGEASIEDFATGYSTQADGVVLKPKVSAQVDQRLLELSRSDSTEGRHVHDFFLALAACNTIVPVTFDTPDPGLKLIEYQGESPDEQALVYAAATYGFMLVERTAGYILIDVLGQRKRFNVLGIHEFDSNRKRMSVVLGCPDKTAKVFVKGADVSMFSVADTSSNLDILNATEDHLHSYSSKGLRTLVIGKRELSSSEFEEWQSSYQSATSALVGRATLVKSVANNVENHLSILGASGIEDKLQQGVPEAIESLRKAGIKVWVLTGDKQETAISIGFSSRLLTGQMIQIVINCNSEESCRRFLEDSLLTVERASSDAPDTETDFALIIDGTSLVHILDSELEVKLFELAAKCKVVLCCRVAPLQKAGIVALVKNRTDDMTLAIGDGANDVSMIQKADVGIGISGQEGRQAVMASDFAMAQFRFLVPLLLVHGHWNYHRMAYMVLYNFYRNAVYVLVLFWYMPYVAFGVTTAITDWSGMFYSVIYTSLPTIIVGMLDKDLRRRTLLKYPELYGAGQRNESYNGKLFWLTMLDTLWQSVAIYFVAIPVYWATEIDVSSIGDLWIIAVVVVVNLHLAMDVLRWDWIVHAGIWGSIVATFICVMVVDCLPFLPGYWAFFHAAGTVLFWFCLLGMIVGALLPRFIVKAVVQSYRPSDIQIARESEKFGNLNSVQTEMDQIPR